MNISGAIRRFERRSRILQWQAWLFLLLVVILMAFGAYIIFTASSLTARDIGGQDFDKRLESTQAEISKLNEEYTSLVQVIGAERSACGKAYGELFSRWPVDEATKKRHTFGQLNFPTDHLPDGDEVARLISSEVAKTPGFAQNSFQLNFFECDPAIFLVGGPETFEEIVRSLAGRGRAFDRSRLVSAQKRSVAVAEQRDFLNSVSSTIYAAKVQAAATGSAGAPPTQSSDNSDLLLRLIQTSITRFGVLAVIGFLVSILVSLYRYNIRLSAFYIARADIMRLSGENTTVSDFAVLAAALTPHLEFGKTPPPPLAQLSDLIKSVKDAK